jgi:hypothetical protein
MAIPRHELACSHIHSPGIRTTDRNGFRGREGRASVRFAAAHAHLKTAAAENAANRYPHSKAGKAH